jgi:hypothetical protein
MLTGTNTIAFSGRFGREPFALGFGWCSNRQSRLGIRVRGSSFRTPKRNPFGFVISERNPTMLRTFLWGSLALFVAIGSSAQAQTDFNWLTAVNGN